MDLFWGGGSAGGCTVCVFCFWFSGGGDGIARRGVGEEGGEIVREVEGEKDFADGCHRRLARRGGVKRISGTIYDDVRGAMKDRIWTVR